MFAWHAACLLLPPVLFLTVLAPPSPWLFSEGRRWAGSFAPVDPQRSPAGASHTFRVAEEWLGECVNEIEREGMNSLVDVLVIL